MLVKRDPHAETKVNRRVTEQANLLSPLAASRPDIVRLLEAGASPEGLQYRSDNFVREVCACSISNDSEHLSTDDILAHDVPRLLRYAPTVTDAYASDVPDVLLARLAHALDELKAMGFIGEDRRLDHNIMEFTYGRLHISDTVRSIDRSIQTSREQHRGLLVVKTVECDTITTTFDVETTVMQLDYVHRLFDYQAHRAAEYLGSTPQRVSRLLAARPEWLDSVSWIFDAPSYDQVTSSTLVRSTSHLDTDISTRRRVTRGVNGQTAATVGRGLLIAGGAIVAVSAATIMIPALLIGGAAVTLNDPCLVVGPYVVAGWENGPEHLTR